MFRVIVLSAVLTLSSAGVVEAAAPVMPVVAQYASQEQESSSRTRYSGRSTRGVVKLIGFGAVGVLAVGGWVLKKMRGE